ncbi:MAG: hypothetical protein FJ110_05660 [Deltaproteobacteria bacterium]|nr:hypothetical protein [Deltaproteobacteria bacterium]
MSDKEKRMEEKLIIEEDLKGLEKEIDAAVDRLFVEKSGEPLKNAAVIPSLSSINETVLEIEPEGIEKEVEWELSAPEPEIPLTPVAPITPVASLSVDPLEPLETQLLSLEWEITNENLVKTAKEVLELKGTFKENRDISSVLNRMKAVLNFMIQNEEGIQPHWIQMLLDSKETIKLLLRDETEKEIGIYKRLALAGMEARFSSLEEISGVTPKPISASTVKEEERAPASLIGSELTEKIAGRVESFSAKLDEMMEKLNQHLSVHEETRKSPGTLPVHDNLIKTKITVFKIGEKLLGVESHKVFKLFKVPVSLRENLNEIPTFRLQGLEVRMVDLENLFPVPESERGEERQILILKEDGTYKGLLIDRVLNRLSGSMEQGETSNGHLLGMIRWTYKDLPIRIPVLDLEKF